LKGFCKRYKPLSPLRGRSVIFWTMSPLPADGAV